MKDRTKYIKSLKDAIEKQRHSIEGQKRILAAMENKLEKQRYELLFQQSMRRFDSVDGIRQEICEFITAQNNANETRH